MEEPTVQQTGNETPQGDAAPQTVTTTNGAEPVQAAAPAESDEVRGLKAAAEAERRKRQEIEAQFQGFVAQVAQQQARPVQLEQPSRKRFSEQFTESDLLDPNKVKQAFDLLEDGFDAKLAQAQNRIAFQLQCPDYEQLVETIDPRTGTYVLSDVMQEAFARDPSLKVMLAQSGNPKVTAYLIAKREKELRDVRAALAANQSGAAASAAREKAVARSAANTADALTAPMSPSAVAGASPSGVAAPDVQQLLKNPRALDEIIQGISAGKYG